MDLEYGWSALRSDEGVSPVIAVILMVAITVVLAATVYVWVSGFATEDTGPEQASATAKGADLNDNGDTEWIRLTLTSGENAPYDEGDVTYSATDPDGNALGDAHLCISAQSGGPNASANECYQENLDGVGDIDSADETERFFQSFEDRSWDAGENLWIPCQKAGNHLVTVSVRDSTILDTSVTCHEASSA